MSISNCFDICLIRFKIKTLNCQCSFITLSAMKVNFRYETCRTKYSHKSQCNELNHSDLYISSAVKPKCSSLTKGRLGISLMTCVLHNHITSRASASKSAHFTLTQVKVETYDSSWFYWLLSLGWALETGLLVGYLRCWRRHRSWSVRWVYWELTWYRWTL